MTNSSSSTSTSTSTTSEDFTAVLSLPAEPHRV
jgi:hypothetical protein